ncbi:MAG: hypothetical protein ACLR1D_00190 [Dialister sp.]
MEEKNMYRCPIRYYSIVTVPKDFISQETVIPPGKTEMTEEEKENTFRDIENREKEKSTYATVVNSLTPYAFVLIETETGAPYWQYLDLAGSLQKSASPTNRPMRRPKKSSIPAEPTCTACTVFICKENKK